MVEVLGGKRESEGFQVIRQAALARDQNPAVIPEAGDEFPLEFEIDPSLADVVRGLPGDETDDEVGFPGCEAQGSRIFGSGRNRFGWR